jgi:hypothetical protein
MTGRVMNDSERLQLQKMISANDTTNQTELIRKIKHSKIIKSETLKIQNILTNNINMNTDDLKNKCIAECDTLYTLYTDIFNRLVNKEINMDLFNKFIIILEEIEDGVIDQHDGSFKIGNVLKEIYIDSSITKADKINNKYDNDKQNQKNVCISQLGCTKLSWNDYKLNK